MIDDNLVVEAKGIYSIEKLLIARRLMYWQVYLHKTVLSAEQLLVNILKRAKELSINGIDLFATPGLNFFLKNNINKSHVNNNTFREEKKSILDYFNQLYDNDILASAKVWTEHSDTTLSLFLFSAS